MTLPLAAIGNQGSSFQLVDGTFVITSVDGSEIYLDTNDFAGQQAAELSLQPGGYSVELQPNWTLQREVDGGFSPVEATLTSDNPQTFTIVDGQTTPIQVSFLAGDEVVVGGGTLRIGISVVEAACESPMLECDGDCVDPSSDVTHCGACDVECTSDQVCADGACTDTSCNGDGICNPDYETVDDCYVDCGSCGDGVCSTGNEDASTCPDDCGAEPLPCDDPIELDPTAAGTGNFGTTGATCYRIARTINGWGISNMHGRQVSVNGVNMESQCPEAQGNCSMPLPDPVDGYMYFHASAGNYAWASIYWW